MKNKPFLEKLITGLLAGLIVGATFMRVVDKFLTFIPGPVNLALSVGLLIVALIAVFINKGSQAFWIGAIRYGIAFDLALFGFQKFFHQQFNVPLGMLDEPFTSLSKMWLMWAFFGRSYEFIWVVAIIQIIGASLLVFNRTRLLAVIVLIPVMLNIILLDYFYEIELGVLTHALFLFAGLIYLLMLDYRRLVDFFLNYTPTESLSFNTGLKYAGRLSIIAIPLLLLFTYESDNKHPDLKGRHVVTDMKINGKPAMAKDCADSLLTTVYFDLGNECVFEFNSQKRRMFGWYHLDNGAISTEWRFPPAAHDKTFSGSLKRRDNNNIELSGIMNGDTVEVSLQKQKM